MKTAPDRRLAKCRTITTYELSHWHRGDAGHRRAIKHYKKAWHRAIRRAGKTEIHDTIVVARSEAA
jgi:hypothetical protein